MNGRGTETSLLISVWLSELLAICTILCGYYGHNTLAVLVSSSKEWKRKLCQKAIKNI